MSETKKRSISHVDGSDEEDFAGFDDNLIYDDLQVHEIGVNKRDVSPIKVPKNSKDTVKKSYNDPIYRKPFDYLWKREVVYRALQNERNTQKEKGGDVYYITPTNKKLRTKQEILNHLDKYTDLTIENFTFAKEPVGGTSEQEIIRYAKVYPNSKRSSDAFIYAQAESAQIMGKRTPKPKLPKGASPPPENKYMVKIPSVSDGSNGNEHELDRSSKLSKIKRNNCSIDCYKAMGSIPQLHCQKCFRLFHHECMDMSKDATKTYICKDCINTKEKLSPNNPIKGNSAQHKILSVKDNSNRENNKTAPIQTIAVIAGRKYVVVSSPNSSLTEESNNLNQNEQSRISPTPIKNEQQMRQKNLNVKTEYGVSSESSELVVSKFRTKKEVINKFNGNSMSFAANFFGNVSVGYDILLHTFQYLKVQELLRCTCVCRMWEKVGNHTTLWKTVRMKNSMVNDWSGLANKLKNNNTRSLDLKKMLLASNFNEMWENFSKNIGTATNLRSIDFCRCPAKVIECLFETNPYIETINAVTINSNEIDLKNIVKATNLREFRLRSTDCIDIISDISSFKELDKLVHLSLTSVNKLASKDISILQYLSKLETLELGECSNFPDTFASSILPKLTNLEKLRLEKWQQNCNTSKLLDTIAKLPKLTQLELINFDVQADFDIKISNCVNIKKLLLIPTYVSQSATTNKLILSGVLKMYRTLEKFIWTITNELLRVTELYTEEGSIPKCDSIPVLKPMPFNDFKSQHRNQTSSDISQIEIVPLSNIESILLQTLSNTKIKLLKLPLAATWKQSMSDF
ncbi:uncharacterized protein LOC134834386 isoform X1 [Culicoides brevitarsis]|uniref:uncharacterized protein LOC134834386 isoform X1 n=1 Tax=Culicoides brevitarsis TaxID=469753 RepID=UPI00307C8280